MHVRIHDGDFYNLDCISGCREHVPDDSIDLIITDPPYGIDGPNLHRHYNRDESHVVDGYVEVPMEQYGSFTRQWVAQAERILRPGGQIYVVSGYTNLYHILDSLRDTDLQEVNHIIWKYNFGVYTRRKYVSSHYHILYYAKPGGNRVFNTECRYGFDERDDEGGSLNYQDREDVWIINREYKHGRTKNKNELPQELLVKILQYSSNEGDHVCDLFLGGFSTARVAIGLNRRCTGFEISQSIFRHGISQVEAVQPGDLVDTLREPVGSLPENYGQRWTEEEVGYLLCRYRELRARPMLKKEAVSVLCKELGRGRFGIQRILRTHKE